MEKGNDYRPLADRMRPASIEGYIGQKHILDFGKPLRMAIEKGFLHSMIFWGPPGTGKTTLAKLISKSCDAQFLSISAVLSGVKDIRTAIDKAEQYRNVYNKDTILFVDEAHRFNKSQQDVILPYVENGTFTLIGATTENPSFEVIAPLLSRCRVFTLKKLSPDEISEIINRAIHDKENGLGLVNPNIDYKAVELIANMASGDARWALNTLELVINSRDSEKTADCISDKKVMEVVQTKSINYDKQGDSHYDTISAFIKSIRASDPDSAIYWLARMLSGGEDPMFIARRLIISASEDIGLADPRALTVATSAQHAVHVVGLPEGRIPLAEATIYLAAAPKSNSAYRSINEAMNEVSRSGDLPVPLHLRNPVTDLMKDSGYGSNYKYAHNYEGHFVKTQNMPEELQTSKYYHPGNLGFESRITDRLNMLWGKE